MLGIFNNEQKTDDTVPDDEEQVFYAEEPCDPDQWPYGGFELTLLLQKWIRKISVDLAAHVPPKMACMIGTFWSIFGQESGYKDITFALLNNLIFIVWLKNMVNIVNVNAGFIYQLSKQEQYDAMMQEVRCLLPCEVARKNLQHRRCVHDLQIRRAEVR